MSTQTTQSATPQYTANEAVRRELLDNDQVRVIETEYPVGGSVPVHAHRFPHLLYVIDGGAVETTDADGVVNTLDLMNGEALWTGPQRHSARNVGPTPVRILEVEVKDRPTLTSGDSGTHAFDPTQLQWAVDSFDPTRSVARLVGDPARPGPYIVRFLGHPGYSIALHRHPDEDEHLTVISGEVHWSEGEAGSGAPEHVLPAGGFLVFPAGTPHRLWVTEETVLQMSGIGPRTYVYAAGDGHRSSEPAATLDFP